ncbi:MAG TPA: hypothetical protein DEG17_07030 [Cyanobacteria bacterium UBA11149]|nr:hypothetical protein [Cyanobacteria bacterium UBA11367]HBE59410.1 hypothetical protein [Cyanobacteria bacterium UBA11366]HBK64851.1 hypothetical protein [Cyanobacteria bacterium UBA11166]HBR74925.1 hypothetical protein [Cyanobacteria bacterium UBA11159]HBS69464.1 hypothetical protein [Cyanobacteria bacterium UBA11153]HBW88619.1 hypothetical protein [Cyanobacteria bacterium UBA11149]HCA97108.1 hypothetical protein [Cyanobacteria bacterium UBA9226]
MSVNILYCEGGDKSPDIRILSKILAGVCTVQSFGSKYGFKEKICIARGFQPATVGIRDRDFDDEEDSPPINIPRTWSGVWQNKTVQLGWLWERREIENYIIDPDVVRIALGSKAPSPSEYIAALNGAANLITDYSAARIALSQSRIKKPEQLRNYWTGKSGGQHPFPDSFTEADCEAGIRASVRDYGNIQSVTEADVLHKFQQILPTCRAGGVRFQYYLTFFAGKDLLCGMERVGASFIRGTAWDFRNVLVESIAKSSEDVWTWLPEWQALRHLIATAYF